MHWPGFVPAFLDPEYDTHITEIEGIERARIGPPLVIAPVVAVDPRGPDLSSAQPVM